MSEALDQIRARLAAAGLEFQGVAPGEGLGALLPGCRSVVVFASGRRLWEAFIEDLRENPEHLSGEAHPLDAFVVRLVRAVDPEPVGRRWIFCGALEAERVDFRMLAAAAGLGWRGRLGLLMHPEAGPWMGLRAACLTVEGLAAGGELSGEGFCQGCEAPCVSACPAGAVDRARGWQVGPCARHQGASSSCEGGCLSRVACPAGAAHRYGELQLRYHSHRATGRPMLAAALGIEDRRAGIGPGWEAWA